MQKHCKNIDIYTALYIIISNKFEVIKAWQTKLGKNYKLARFSAYGKYIYKMKTFTWEDKHIWRVPQTKKWGWFAKKNVIS